jgi:hypothetical protein
MSIEEVKDKLRAGLAKSKDAAQITEIVEAIALLDALPEPSALASAVQHQMERVRGARTRAKLDAQHGIMAMLTAAQAAVWPEGNTHRDGFVRGLEEAHKHCASIAEDEPEET